LALRLIFALFASVAASGAGAESLRDALTGNWALMDGSQLATDAENIAAAETACAEPEFGAYRGVVLGVEDDRFAMEAWEGGEMLDAWDFDKDVRGARLDDGRIAMRFSVAGAPSHELTFWKATIEGAERDLLELLGPPAKSGFYLKCP
jgi:hypothetical protein